MDENTKNNVQKCPPVKDTKRKIIQKKFEVMCHDLSLGFVTKTKAWKHAGQECNPEVTFTFMIMQDNVKE